MENSVTLVDKNEFISEVESFIEKSVNAANSAVSSIVVVTYWNVGRMIVEEEQGGNITPEYGRKIYLELAKRLTKKMGKGFSRSNLFNMRNFYITYPIVQTYGQLSWSHFCELIGIKDENERKFYEKETVNSKWSTRELGRQIESGLYQRLLLSDGKANKEKVFN